MTCDDPTLSTARLCVVTCDDPTLSTARLCVVTCDDPTLSTARLCVVTSDDLESTPHLTTCFHTTPRDRLPRSVSAAWCTWGHVGGVMWMGACGSCGWGHVDGGMNAGVMPAACGTCMHEVVAGRGVYVSSGWVGGWVGGGSLCHAGGWSGAHKSARQGEGGHGSWVSLGLSQLVSGAHESCGGPRSCRQKVACGSPRWQKVAGWQ